MAERVPDAKERLQREEKQKMKTIRKARRPWLQFGQHELTEKVSIRIVWATAPRNLIWSSASFSEERKKEREKERKKDGMDYNSESLRVLLASHGAVFWRSRLLKGFVICSVFIQDGGFISFETHTTKQIDAIVPSKSRTAVIWAWAQRDCYGEQNNPIVRRRKKGHADFYSLLISLS